MTKKLVRLSGGCLESMIKAQRQFGIKPGPTAKKLEEVVLNERRKRDFGGLNLGSL